MKKIYIIPQCVVVDVVPLSIIATSPNLEVGGGMGSEGDPDNGFMEDAGAARGDWSSIWDGM